MDFDDSAGFEEVVSRKDKKKVHVPPPKSSLKTKAHKTTVKSPTVRDPESKPAVSNVSKQQVKKSIPESKTWNASLQPKQLTLPVVPRILLTEEQIRLNLTILFNMTTAQNIDSPADHSSDVISSLCENAQLTSPHRF